MKATVIVALILAVPSIALAETEVGVKGQIAGSLMFAAALMDALYSKCQLGGKPYNTNSESFREMIQKKWGIPLNEIAKQMDLERGYPVKDDANRMADDAIRKFQGCDSKGMAGFVNTLENSTQADLERFNKIK